MRERRLKRLRAEMAIADLEALVIAAPEQLSHANVLYLSGFTGSAAHLLVTAAHAWLVTDFRYLEQAAREAPHFELVRQRSSVGETLAQLVRDAGIRQVGFEDDKVPVSMHRAWEGAMPGVLFQPATGLIERLRLIKDAGEVEAIRRAALLSGRALEDLLTRGIRGMTERALAVELECAMRRLGLDGVGFPTIVGSGPRGSEPHAHPSERVMQDGELVTVDFGGLMHGYRSDETVTVALGTVPSKLREVFDIVHEAQAAGRAAVKPGALDRDMHRACRRVIEAAGYGDYFGHGSGHGVGLDVHEPPFSAREPDYVLEPGMTITVEPGIYLPGVGGVRLEDTLVVTESGHERLTTLSKDWRVL